MVTTYGELYVKVTRATYALLLSLVASAHSSVAAYEELSDEQLELVTAGTAASISADGAFDLEFHRVLQSGATVSGTGALLVQEGYSPTSELSSVIISDNAQGNLSAVVNVNAANSSVNILLNLNINVNSSVGNVEQINITGPDGPINPP